MSFMRTLLILASCAAVLAVSLVFAGPTDARGKNVVVAAIDGLGDVVIDWILDEKPPVILGEDTYQHESFCGGVRGGRDRRAKKPKAWVDGVAVAERDHALWRYGGAEEEAFEEEP